MNPQQPFLSTPPLHNDHQRIDATMIIDTTSSVEERGKMGNSKDKSKPSSGDCLRLYPDGKDDNLELTYGYYPGYKPRKGFGVDSNDEISIVDNILCHFSKIPQIQTAHIYSKGVISGHPSGAAVVRAPPFTLFSKESLKVDLDSDGFRLFLVAGFLDVKFDDQKINGFFKIKTENRGTPGMKFKADTSIDRGIFFKKNILGIKGRDQPFPAGQARPLRWTLNSKDESNVPIKINCETFAIVEQTKVMIKYNAFSLFNLENVHISIPIKSGEAPIDKIVIEVGSCRYDSRETKEHSRVHWSI